MMTLRSRSRLLVTLSVFVSLCGLLFRSLCVSLQNERERESPHVVILLEILLLDGFFFLSLSSKKKKNKQEQNFRWDHRCIKINTDSIIFASLVVYIFYYLMVSMIYMCGWLGGCVLHCQLQLQPNDWRLGVCVFLCRFLSSGVTCDLQGTKNAVRSKGEGGKRRAERKFDNEHQTTW